jgi:hypothetical protein
MTTYVGFAIADSMFGIDALVQRKAVSIEWVRENHPYMVVCANPSHLATFQALEGKHGIKLTIPTKAPLVGLVEGDSLVVLSVRGLPRLEGRHEYTVEEIDKAAFYFSQWTVLK